MVLISTPLLFTVSKSSHLTTYINCRVTMDKSDQISFSFLSTDILERIETSSIVHKITQNVRTRQADLDKSPLCCLLQEDLDEISPICCLLRSDLDKSSPCCLLAQTYNSYFSTHLLTELHFTIEYFLGYSLTLDVFPSRILSCQYLCCHTACVFLIYWATPTYIPPPHHLC